MTHKRGKGRYVPPTPKPLSDMTRKCYASFDDYVKDYPEGEHFRRWLTNDGRNNVILVPGDGWSNFLPGGYLWASCVHCRWTEFKTKLPMESFFVAVHDSDDGCAIKRFADMASAEAEYALLPQLAPFCMSELVQAFGYNWE